MKNVTISLDEKTLQKSREYASQHGLTLNSLIRQLLQKTLGTANRGRLEEAFELSDKLGLKTQSDWTRDELYDV